MTRTEGLAVSGFGVVVNLDGTGDSKAPNAVRQYIIKQMVTHKGGSSLIPGAKQMSPERMLSDSRVAIVEVLGMLPPGSRKGQRFDVQVSALPDSDTTSLARGTLWTTELRLRGTDYRDPGGSVN